MKKLLAIVAHPDDESFGFGGTLAKYAREGVEIHVMCATRGEEGKSQHEQEKLGSIREQELLTASKILGVTKVEFLDYHDGTLSNNLYHEVAAKIEAKTKSFQPDVVVTFDRLGISGHIDHMFMSMVTTFVCNKFRRSIKLFYLCELKSYTRLIKGYFIYFPPGYQEKEIDLVIDITSVWDIKKQAMYAHQSQLHDVRRILLLKRFFPKREYFRAAFRDRKKTKVGDDLFAA